MPTHRVRADKLVSVVDHCRRARLGLESALELHHVAGVPAGVPEAAGAVEAAEEAVTDLLEEAPLAFELPIWADEVRLRMIQRTLEDYRAESGTIVADDVALALQLVQLALDAVESSS